MQSSRHRDILVRAAKILRKAEDIVDKQEALVLRARASQLDSKHAEAVLEFYRETLQAFRRTYDIIASEQEASESDLKRFWNWQIALCLIRSSFGRILEGSP